MLDERMKMMLKAANTLTAGDLDVMRNVVSTATVIPAVDAVGVVTAVEDEPVEPMKMAGPILEDRSASTRSVRSRKAHARKAMSPAVISRGKYERQRTRESKVSTECVGEEREKHDWWPVGTELVGEMGPDIFTATVVENAQVKSGRSILITSGPAAGKLCITPTGAAIEATEAYRQKHNLGRGGGVTNGWSFWKAG
jgi:hypothetical protein